MGSWVPPVVGGPDALVERDRVAVGLTVVVVVQALAVDPDGAVGLHGPLLRGGAAVAGVNVDLVGVGGAAEVVVQAFARDPGPDLARRAGAGGAERDCRGGRD